MHKQLLTFSVRGFVIVSYWETNVTDRVWSPSWQVVVAATSDMDMTDWKEGIHTSNRIALNITLMQNFKRNITLLEIDSYREMHAFIAMI